MSINGFSINSAGINGPAVNLSTGPSSNFTGSADLFFSQLVTGNNGNALLSIDQVVSDLGEFHLSLVQDVANPFGNSNLLLTQNIGQSGNSVLSFSQNVYSQVGVSDSWVNWDASIIVNNIDISDQVLGTLTITADRSSARVADFSVLLSGIVKPPEWIGQPVSINYIQNNGSIWRRFSGIIQRAKYNISTGVLSISCSDDLQLIIDAHSNDQLLSLTNALHSDHIFNADNTGWDRFQDLLKTVDYSVEFNSARQLITNDFQNKIIPDFTFDQNLILDNSLSVNLVERSQLVNRVDIEFDARYNRIYQKKINFSWSYSRPLSIEFFNPLSVFPDRTMVREAIESSGLHFIDASFTSLWPTNIYHFNGQKVVYINNFPEGIRGFNARSLFRWNQSVTDKFKVTVLSPGSVATNGGELVKKVSASFQSETNFSDWGSVDDDYSITPAGMVADGTGIDRLDDADDVSINNSLSVLTAMAQVIILSSHRQNSIVFEVPLSPYIELNQTIETTDSNVHSKGVINSFTETYDFDSGMAITEINLAISAGGSGLDSINFSPALVTKPALLLGDSLVSSVVLDEHIGGLTDSLEQQPDWTGFIVNTGFISFGANVYNNAGFHIPFDGIDDSNRLNKDQIIPSQIKIAIPDNILTITA